MIHILVAHTFELDDADLAVSEIMEQLDWKNSLRKNSIGIISCHAEFLYSGIVKALSDRLPFDVVGITTLGSSINGAMGVDILTMSVLTSEKAVFSTAMSASLRENQIDPVESAYAEARANLPENPSFVIAFGPLLEAVGGEAYIAELNRLCEDAPVFGSLACDHNIDFSDSHVFRNDAYQRDALAMVLVSGPVEPKFFSISIFESNTQKQKGIVTSSTGNVIHTINNMPAMVYFSSIGLAEAHFKISGTVPTMVDYRDGAPPIGRGIYMIMPNGDAVCGGDVPENGAIAPAFLDYAEVIRSTSAIIEDLKKTGTGNGMLIVSCLSRSLVLEAEPLHEAELIEQAVGRLQPYHLMYSGGEICPVYRKDGTTANRFHNFSLTACLF